SSSTGGLITNIGRVSSGDRTGLIESNGYQTGTGGSNQLLSETTFSQRDASVGGVTLSKPIIATSKAYWGTGGSDHDDTTYTFAWWSGTNTSPLYVTTKSVTTTLPAVKNSSPDQNGANTTADAVSYLRKDGRMAISVALDGIYTAVKYNAMGLPVRTVSDADPSVSGDFDTNYGPSDFGLSTSANGGLVYSTEATYDSVGRTVTSVARPDSSMPVKRIAEMYYSKLADGRLATISFPRQDTPVATLTYYGPVSYSVSNHAGKGEFSCTLGVASTTGAKADWLNESYSDPIYALENASANLAGSSRANVFAVGTTIYNTSGSKATESRKYVTLATSSTWTGSAGTDYDRTEYSYDVMGRADRVKDPTDTISRTMFDALGRTSSHWVGTSDSSWPPVASTSAAGDMTQTDLTTYDAAGVGNSLVTKRTAYVEGDSYGFGYSASMRETSSLYDVRGRAIVTIPPVMPCSVTAYDLRNRPTATAMFTSSSGLTAATDPAATGTMSSRTALSKTFYDSRGQVYKTQRYKVTQSDGTDADSLESLTWRDTAGRVIKQGGTANSKTVYDRLGRAVHQYTLARNNDSGYGDASGVSGDIVLEQSDTVYGDADKTGLVVMTASIMRNYDDTSTTGALDTNADNDVYKYTLTGGGSADVKGRIQIMAYWYDELDRPAVSINYGVYKASGVLADFNRAATDWQAANAGARGSIDGALRSDTVYNANGTVQASQAPKVDGGSPLETRWLYDHALRKIAEIKNYKNGTPSGVTGDDDVYTRYTFANGLMATVWVDFDGDNAVDTDDQVTTYTYGTTKGTTTGTSAVKDNRLLDNVLYPAQGFAGETTADRTTAFTYNAQGQKTYQIDNNGTELLYDYDTGGRKISEVLKAAGSGIDTAVQSCGWAYSTRGLLAKVTQYSNTSLSPTYETDEVLYMYDDWGNLTDFRQDNDGAVTSTSPNDYDTYYTYTKVDTTSPTSGTRASGLRRTSAGLYYGAGLGSAGAGTKKEEISYTFTNSSYGTTLYDDDYGRVTWMTRSYPTSSLLLNIFVYGGTGTLVRNYVVESAITDVRADGGTSGWDVGFDRFGRRKRSLWKNGSSGAIYYDARPAYDENSNTTAVENAWVTPWSSTYESDGLNRLKGLEFGVMTTGAISTVVQKEDWQTGGTLKLDQVGNWVDYKRTRESAAQDDWAGNTFNKINVYTKVDKVTGTDIEPEVDKKGLPKWDDKTGGTTVGYQYVFDAWDRLRLVKNTSAVLVEEFRYNGLGHRIAWHYDINASGGAPNGSDDWVHFQYNERWQQMAMYVGTASSPTEVFTYMAAGKDGYGGSSYIDEVVMRERGAERYYYLQNWRHDVVAIMDFDGAIKEKLVYDAYGRPHAFSPGDLKTSGGADRPDGALDTSDTWTTGGVAWNKDIGNSAHKAIPDGVTSNGTSDTDDPVTLTNLKNAGYSAGYGIISDATINNRKGLAGYEFDPILEGDASANYKPVYHVRHRALASDTGKWLQKDPLGYVDGMDLYEYCNSDAIDSNDGFGLCAAKLELGSIHSLTSQFASKITDCTSVLRNCSTSSVMALSRTLGGKTPLVPCSLLCGPWTPTTTATWSSVFSPWELFICFNEELFASFLPTCTCTKYFTVTYTRTCPARSPCLNSISLPDMAAACTYTIANTAPAAVPMNCCTQCALSTAPCVFPPMPTTAPWWLPWITN
ncbi:MAG: hypothetical protein Q8L55_01415, partial [Phycisphaerales bacterium]|nr:hypothetical protein [Phycisphaerales bacterium]